VRVRSGAPSWPVLLALLALAGCGSDRPAPVGTGRALPPGLTLEHSGLLADHPFDNTVTPSTSLPGFRIGGTAGQTGGAVVQRSDGLQIEVGPHELGTWKGLFAASAGTYPASSVFHVRMWRLPRHLVSRRTSAIALFAVQTSDYSFLNYVLVAGVISRTGTYWTIGYGAGNAKYARTKILWGTQSSARYEDIALRTDGHSRFEVYFGRTLVYASHRLRISVEPPFRAYLEVEARGVSYRTRFQNLWIAADDALTVEGLRAGDRVTLEQVGLPSLHAVAGADGRARLALPLSEGVGRGTITIDGPAVNRSFPDVRFAGGDVYKLSR
jgi:hypothetical protein